MVVIARKKDKHAGVGHEQPVRTAHLYYRVDLHDRVYGRLCFGFKMFLKEVDADHVYEAEGEMKKVYADNVYHTQTNEDTGLRDPRIPSIYHVGSANDRWAHRRTRRSCLVNFHC